MIQEDKKESLYMFLKYLLGSDILNICKNENKTNETLSRKISTWNSTACKVIDQKCSNQRVSDFLRQIFREYVTSILLCKKL